MRQFNSFAMNSHVTNHSSNVIVQIALEQDERVNYEIHQPIKVSIVFKSTINNLLFNKRLIIGYDMVLNIKKPSGKSADLKFDLFVGLPNKNDFILLKQYEGFETTIDITDYYILDEIGKYTITAIYENRYDGQEFEFKAWVGKIKSNSLEFIIREK